MSPTERRARYAERGEPPRELAALVETRRLLLDVLARYAGTELPLTRAMLRDVDEAIRVAYAAGMPPTGADRAAAVARALEGLD
jgi:hypothetical protein